MRLGSLLRGVRHGIACRGGWVGLGCKAWIGRRGGLLLWVLLLLRGVLLLLLLWGILLLLLGGVLLLLLGGVLLLLLGGVLLLWGWGVATAAATRARRNPVIIYTQEAGV